MVQQNLPLCLCFAALGGLGTVVASVTVIIPSDREKNGIEVSKKYRNGALAVNVTLQTLLSFVIYPAATWFGPVSLTQPTALSATLFSNLIIFGAIMRREPSTKDTNVATYLAILAVALLPLVGPGIQENQDFVLLLGQTHAITWMVCLVGIFTISTGFMLSRDMKKTKPVLREVCLLCVGITSSVLSPTVSRAASTVGGGNIRTLLIVAYALLQVVWMYEFIIESTAVSSRVKFVPTFMVGSMLCNAITGVIVWEDWKVINSWIGYVSVFLQLILVVYLMSELGKDLGGCSTERGDRNCELNGEAAINQGRVVPRSNEISTEVSEWLISNGRRSVRDMFSFQRRRTLRRQHMSRRALREGWYATKEIYNSSRRLSSRTMETAKCLSSRSLGTAKSLSSRALVTARGLSLRSIDCAQGEDDANDEEEMIEDVTPKVREKKNCEIP